LVSFNRKFEKPTKSPDTGYPTFSPGARHEWLEPFNQVVSSVNVDTRAPIA
jgi:hypothetical protein